MTQPGPEGQAPQLDAAAGTGEAGASSTGERGASGGEKGEKDGKGRDPARIATLVVLALCVVFFLLYVRADRVMPYSDQARISGFAVPIAPQVSGYVTEVPVRLHDVVSAGEVLVQLDTTQYQIALRSARASLDNALQQLGVSSAGVEAAAAGLAAARAQESIARIHYERLEQIAARNANALAQADRDNAAAALRQAEAAVEASEADLERAEAALGPEGFDNPAVRAAFAALEGAEFNLSQTTLRAPTRGAIESLQLDVGHFAGAGQPLMTFVSTSDVWIQADMKENNLAYLEPGTTVRIILDSAPGRVFVGSVRSVGFGVGSGGPTTRGELPKVSPTTGWLRQPQRFPVIVDLGEDVPSGLLRVGGQVSVMAFTGREGLLNPLGRLIMRFFTIMSYVR
jgi:multidrug resistance efflux pump